MATAQIGNLRHDGTVQQQPSVPAEHSALMQSRETGDVIPAGAAPLGDGKVKALPFAKSWVHLMAGG